MNLLSFLSCYPRRRGKTVLATCLMGLALSSFGFGQNSFTVLPFAEPDQMSWNGQTFAGHNHGPKSILDFTASNALVDLKRDTPSVISGDGSTAVVFAKGKSNVYTAGGLQISIASFDEGLMYPDAISRDGKTQFFTEVTDDGVFNYSYNSLTGYTGIPNPTGTSFAFVTTASADGSVAYGSFATGWANFSNAFMWTPGAGTQSIGNFFPMSASRDGSLVIGYNNSGNIVYWNKNTATGGTAFPGYSRFDCNFGLTPNGGYVYANSKGHGLLQNTTTGVVTDLGLGSAIVAGSNTRFLGYRSGGNGQSIYQPGMGWTDLIDLLTSKNLVTPSSFRYFGIQLTDDGSGIYGEAVACDKPSFAWYANIPVILPPAAADDSYSTPYNTELDVPAPGVMANDTNATPAMYAVAALVTGPTHASTFGLNSDGSFSYVPVSGYRGPDSFTYEVTNPAGVSNIATVQLNVGILISSLNPNRYIAGGPSFTLTSTGSGYVAGDVLMFNGVAMPTTVLSPTQLTADIPVTSVSDGGFYPVYIQDSTGATSNTVTYLVANLVPTISSISPNSVQHGSGSFVMTVTGSHFSQDSVVIFGQVYITPTYISSTQLQAVIPAVKLVSPGTVNVFVHNSVPAGGNSAILPFTIN